MKQAIPHAELIDVDSIKVFVSRARDRDGFDQLKQSIASVGLKVPIQVRDISNRPKDERNGHKFELICGQGRLTAFRELGKRKIPALVIDAPEVEIVGRFLAENMIREPLPWSEKAKLVKADLDAGMTVADVAAKFSISEHHAVKFQRILSKTSAALERVVSAMPMNDAEVFTTLPEGDQAIVVEVMRETGEREIQSLVRKAKQVTETEGQLSKTALTKSIQRVDEDLKRLRDKLKLARLHHSLGPQNVAMLLQDKAFRKAAERESIPLAKFEKTIA